MTADAKKSQAEFEDFDEREFAKRAALIEEAGAREWTSQEAHRQHATALAALETVDMPEHVRSQLTALADFVAYLAQQASEEAARVDGLARPGALTGFQRPDAGHRRTPGRTRSAPPRPAP